MWYFVTVPVNIYILLNEVMSKVGISFPQMILHWLLISGIIATNTIHAFIDKVLCKIRILYVLQLLCVHLSVSSLGNQTSFKMASPTAASRGQTSSTPWPRSSPAPSERLKLTFQRWESSSSWSCLQEVLLQLTLPLQFLGLKGLVRISPSPIG